MRALIATGLFLSSVITGSAQASPTISPLAPGAQYDIPMASKAQRVMIIRGGSVPGTIGTLHIHPGVEMTYVAQGDLEVWIGHSPPRIYHAGEALFVPREVPHQVKNVGTVPTILYVTLVVDKDSPAIIPFQGPALAH